MKGSPSAGAALATTSAAGRALRTRPPSLAVHTPTTATLVMAPLLHQLVAAVLLLVAYTHGMSIPECEDTSGYTVFVSNGFTIHVDSYTKNLLPTLSEARDEDGNFRTYQSCIDHATSTARASLLSRTDNDRAFELSLSKVPFRVYNGKDGEHFAYSGGCARGCVYSQVRDDIGGRRDRSGRRDRVRRSALLRFLLLLLQVEMFLPRARRESARARSGGGGRPR
jgi:hypothetical protein